MMSKRSICIAAGLLVLLSVAGAALITGNPAQEVACPAGACSDCPNAAACSEAKSAATAKTPVIEAARCNGCTRCVMVAPKTFAMTADGSRAKVIDPAGDQPEVIKAAADGCRRGAITYR